MTETTWRNVMSVRADASKQRRGIRAAARIFMAFNFFLYPSFFISFYTFSRPSHLLLSHSQSTTQFYPLHFTLPCYLHYCTFFRLHMLSFLVLLRPRLYTLHIFLYFDFHFLGRTGITYNSLLHLRLDTYHSHSSMASISEDNCLLDFPPHYSSCTILSSPFHFIFQRLYTRRVAWRRSL